MHKKIISSILVAALLNLLGCYSSNLVSVAEYNQINEEDKPNDIFVKTKDYREYHFSDSNFYIDNDTLYGKAIFLLGEERLPFEGEFAFWEIESIQLEDFEQRHPTLMMVSQYQKIETETGKPDEIFLTKNDNTKYQFMKNDYFIENDTLYGKGKLILEGEQQFDRKIALSEIESIKVESLNEVNTSLSIVGLIAVIVIFVVAAAAYERSIRMPF